jgi:hypothetical protein
MPPRHSRYFVIAMILGLLSFNACSGSSATPTTTTDDVVAPPATDAIAPGECRKPEELATITIRTAGKTFEPTLGVGSSDCTGTTGTGYLIHGYEPILIDATSTFEITIDGEANTTIDWPAADPLQPSGSGNWKSPKLSNGCNRLTIALASTDGTATATYGADIRVGGDTVTCAVRDAPPLVDPSDSVPFDTAPPGSLVLPSIVEPPPITN